MDFSSVTQFPVFIARFICKFDYVKAGCAKGAAAKSHKGCDNPFFASVFGCGWKRSPLPVALPGGFVEQNLPQHRNPDRQVGVVHPEFGQPGLFGAHHDGD